MTKLFTLCFSLLVISSVVAEPMNYSQENSASIKLIQSGKGTIAELVSVRYLPLSVDVKGIGENKPAFIEEVTRSKMDLNSEFRESVISAKLWVFNKDVASKLWEHEIHADSAQLYHGYYVSHIHDPGCCLEGVYRKFDVETGKYMYSYSTEPLWVEMPRKKEDRHIVYLSSKAIEDFDYKEFPSLVGVVSLYSDAKLIDQIGIEIEDDAGWTPAMNLMDSKGVDYGSRLIVYESDMKTIEDLKDFSVRLIFDGGTELVVPVYNDQFSAASLTFPEGVKIRRLMK